MNNSKQKAAILVFICGGLVGWLQLSDARDQGKAMTAAKSNLEARHLFGHQRDAASLPAAALGSYAKGCLAGARELAVNGPHWQAMRLSRNRNWAHPALVSYIERFSADAVKLDGWPGLLIGDISQPRGGPMLSGHKSHQIGLDVDIWFRPAPSRILSPSERESLSSDSLIKDRFRINRKTWNQQTARLLKRAASYSEVARIFVHPTIKKELCDWAGNDRGWLRKIRAWYGHHAHFHVRLQCPGSDKFCENQPQPPAGDGCGDELAWWLSADAYRPKPKKPAAKPLVLTDLPVACGAVLESK